jgi:outer membrane protein, heavy metal efflux system
LKIGTISLVCALPLAAGTLTVREAVERALASHPALGVAAERVAALEGLRQQAALRLNPRFIFQTENLRGWQSPEFRFGTQTDTFAYLQQTLETAGKRERRTELAEANRRRGDLERELLRRQIAARVKAAYWNAAAAQRLLSVWEEAVANFEQVVRFHEARVREGAMAEVDLIRVQVERERLSIQAVAARLEAERTRIALYREMGQTEIGTDTLADTLEAAPAAPPVADAARALENRMEMEAARQEEIAARSNVRLQQATARPNLEVLGGYKRSGPLDTLIAGVQVDLPFLNRNQGAIASAEAGVRAAQRYREVQEAAIRAEVKLAEAEVNARLRQVRDSLGPLRSRAAESSRIAQAAYREGGTDLLRLLDAERVRLDAEALYFRTWAEYHQAVIALEIAMGVFP